jgi:protein-glutamine gamma-glutamyltransferase
MTRERALSIAVYLLVSNGVAALFLGGLIGVAGLVVVGVLVAGSWWQEPLRRRVERVPRLGVALVTLAAVGLAVEIAASAPSMLDVFTHLLVFLLLVKLYTRRTPRDARDVSFLTFFMLVAASPVTTSVVFLGLFVTFLVVGTWLLMLRHVLNESDDAVRPALARTPALGFGRDLFSLALAASAATIAVTGLLFVIIPRVGQAALPMQPGGSRMVSGFSERVRLGAFGEIEADAAIVMRVQLTQFEGGRGAPESLPSLRWRGIAFDHFDGREWTVSHSTLKLTLRRELPVPFPIHRHYGGPVLTQEIHLEPLGSAMIFGAPRVVRLQGRSDLVTIDDLGNIAVAAPSARLQYTVESEPEIGDPRRLRIADTLVPHNPRWQARYTQLPSLPPRIRALAREVTAGSSDPYDAARRLTAWLSRELTYTRVLEASTTTDPLEDFLFVRRSGNCEYFAAALAVMARSLGIPARVVNGFQRGEWNPYGHYFMVRLRDAHSWVEVFVDGAGWVTLDPSPRGAVEPAPIATPATLWFDALRMSWYRYVVTYSVHDQLAAVEMVRRTTWRWSAAALRPSEWGEVPLLRAAAAGAVLVAAAFVVAAGWRRRRTVPAGVAVPGFYARALRVLARRGLTPGVGETAREFAGRARATAWAAPLTRLTGVYERVRFGGAVLTPAETAAVDAALAELTAAVRAAAPARRRRGEPAR